MRQPMLWMFLFMSAFVLLFFVGTVHFQGGQSAVFQVIGFGGMIFSMLYGLLLSQHAEENAREKQEE